MGHPHLETKIPAVVFFDVGQNFFQPPTDRGLQLTYTSPGLLRFLQRLQKKNTVILNLLDMPFHQLVIHRTINFIANSAN